MIQSARAPTALGRIASPASNSKSKTLDQRVGSKWKYKRNEKLLVPVARHLERPCGRPDQLRTDLLRIQRETLEMRLVTEELWVRISSVAPAASLTQSLARLRAQLSENYRLQAAEAEAATLKPNNWLRRREQHQQLWRKKKIGSSRPLPNSEKSIH